MTNVLVRNLCRSFPKMKIVRQYFQVCVSQWKTEGTPINFSGTIWIWPFPQISGFSQNLFFFQSVCYTHSRFNEQIQNTIDAVPPRFCRRRCEAFHITWLTFLLTYELFLLETLRCTFWTKFLPFLIMHLSSVMTQYPEQRAQLSAPKPQLSSVKCANYIMVVTSGQS